MPNPEELTKDQLKQALLARGVKLPPGKPLKAVYVELYKKEIIGKKAHVYDLKVSSSHASKLHRNTAKKDSLDFLTNSQISTLLKNLGQTVGPIGPSTRKVYINKLTKFVESGECLTENLRLLKNTDENEEQESSEKEQDLHQKENGLEEKEIKDDSPKSSNAVTKRSDELEVPSCSAVASATPRRPLRSCLSTPVSTSKIPKTVSFLNDQLPSDSASLQSARSRKREAEEKTPLWFWVGLFLLIALVAYVAALFMDSTSLPFYLSYSKN